MKKLHANSLLGILFIPVFAVSAIMSDNFVERFIEPKQYYLFFSFSIALLLFILFSIMKNTRRKIHINAIDLALVLYFLYITIRLALTKNYTFNEPNYIALASLVAFYFVIKHILSNENDKQDVLKLFLTGILLFGCTQAIWGLFQLYEFLPNYIEHFKIGGPYGNPGPYSNYLISVLPLAFGISIFLKPVSKLDQFLHKLAKTTTFLLIVILPATQARTSWMAALVGMVSLTIFRYKDSKLFKVLFGSYLKKLVVISISILLIFFASKTLYSYKKDSAEGRVLIWSLCMDVIQDYPLTGAGFNTFKHMHNEYQSKHFKSGKGTADEKKLADNSMYAFNEYLELTVETGVIGLLLFLGLLTVVLKSRSFKDDTENHVFGPGKIILISKIAIITILVAGLFSYPFHSIPVMLNFYFFIAIVSAYSKNKEVNVSNAISYRIPGVLMIILLVIFIHSQKKKYNATKEWKRTAMMIKKGHTESAIKKYEKLFPILDFHPYFLYNYGAELSVAKQFKKSIEILELTEKKINDADVYTYLGNSYEGLQDLEKAEKSFIKASNIVPHRLYPKYRLVYIYAQTGRTELAYNLASQILNTKTKIESNVTHQIREDLKRFLSQFNAAPDNQN